MIYDAIVVGLGPAGATAAFELSRRGFNVLAIEKSPLPRYKPCGGCISVKTEKILDNDFKSVVERTIYDICLSYRGGEEIHWRSQQPICYMAMRDRFDHYIARKAVESGARTLTERLMGIKERDGKVAAVTDKGTHVAEMLIGADGAGSRVATYFGLMPNRLFASLMEGEIKVKESTLENFAGEMRFDLGSVPYGYGWIFPKARHLSVGAGGFRKSLKNTVPYYSEFLSKCVPDINENYVARRCVLPVFNGESKISSKRCLLVGDAAALVDPFVGEGIYYAIRSAQIAAEVISEGQNPSVYGERITEEIYPEFIYAQKVGKLFYNFPGLTFAILKEHPEFIERFLELSRGDISYRELWGKVKRKVMSEPFISLKKVPELLRACIR